MYLGKDIDTLRKIGQESKDSIPAVFFYRRISIYVTKLLLHTSITPNQITVFSFLLAVISCFLFFLGGYFCVLGGATILQLHVVLDCVDGEIAKIKSLQSKEGALLDVALDRVSDILIFTALAFSIFNTDGNFWIWPLVLLCLSGTLMSDIVGLKVDNLDIPTIGFSRLDKKIVNSRFAIGWGGGANEVVIFIGALANQMVPALMTIALFSNVEWMARLLLNIRRARM